ncbi:Uncharacterised protein [Halioglobus japonicus]|nr:Uncharacterised protein [Halioglobus japonicus]
MGCLYNLSISFYTNSWLAKTLVFIRVFLKRRTRERVTKHAHLR